MATIHLHFNEHVGTTYKRALKRFHLSRDVTVPSHVTLFTLIGGLSNWIVLTHEVEDDHAQATRL
jgi:hypothetical protein